MVEPIKLTSRDLISETTYDGWNSLSHNLCDGVTCKRIKTPDTYEGFLLRYDVGCQTAPHINTDEYEVLNVRSGSIVNLITNETCNEGDTMFINKNEVHEIYCTEEAYVYVITTKRKSELASIT